MIYLLPKCISFSYSWLEWILKVTNRILFNRWVEWIELGNILKQAINLITETGAHLHSITFDGAPVNTSMCESLGTQFSTGKSFIINPVNKENIYCFYDPAHMIKLIRNAFGDKKVLKNGKGGSHGSML